MKIRHPVMIKAAGLVIAWLVRLWIWTVRYRCRCLGPRVEPTEPGLQDRYIYAFWHETLLLPAYRMHQDGMEHFRYLLNVEGGLLQTAPDVTTHLAQLAGAMKGGGARDERNRRFVTAFVRPRGLDVPATPSTVYSASLPCLAVPACSVMVPPGSLTAMKPSPVFPVTRLESTTLPLSSAAAYTVALLSELIELTNSWMLAPAFTAISCPSIVTVSAPAGLVNVNVRCAELASCVTFT